MSFTEEKIDVARLKYFTFFATGSTTLAEAFNPARDWELDKIRIHMSGAYSAVAYFTINMSHHLGSQYDELLLSQAMLGVQDVLFQPEPKLIYHHNDTLQISMNNALVNTFGLEVAFWAITMEPA